MFRHLSAPILGACLLLALSIVLVGATHLTANVPYSRELALRADLIVLARLESPGPRPALSPTDLPDPTDYFFLSDVRVICGTSPTNENSLLVGFAPHDVQRGERALLFLEASTLSPDRCRQGPSLGCRPGTYYALARYIIEPSPTGDTVAAPPTADAPRPRHHRLEDVLANLKDVCLSS